MQYIKLCYKGLVLDANPSSIQINKSKKISKRVVPFGSTKAQEISIQPTVVSGNGVFLGNDALEKATELMRIFDHKGSAHLFVPDAMVFRAYFTDLDIAYDAAKNRVDYSFKFVQDSNDKQSSYNLGFTYARSGENLYDVANRCHVDTDTLFLSNDYRDMFSVKEGDKVWLN